MMNKHVYDLLRRWACSGSSLSNTFLAFNTSDLPVIQHFILPPRLDVLVTVSSLICSAFISLTMFTSRAMFSSLESAFVTALDNSLVFKFANLRSDRFWFDV